MNHCRITILLILFCFANTVCGVEYQTGGTDCSCQGVDDEGNKYSVYLNPDDRSVTYETCLVFAKSDYTLDDNSNRSAITYSVANNGNIKSGRYCGRYFNKSWSYEEVNAYVNYLYSLNSEYQDYPDERENLSINIFNDLQKKKNQDPNITRYSHSYSTN